MFCLIIGSIFSLSQILIATKMDLKNTNLSYSTQQIERKSSMTVAKVVLIGLAVSFVTGALALILSLLSQSVITLKINIHVAFAYFVPLLIGAIYCGLSIFYYKRKLQQSLDQIAM